MDESCKKRNRCFSKITIIFLIISFFALNIIFLFNFQNKNVTYANDKSAYIVMNIDTRDVIISQNANEKMKIASLTKIVTALTVLENTFDLDKKHKIPKEAVGIEGSSIYLREGEELSVRELLYGLMLRSGNDASVALAIITSNSVEKFVELMNDTAIKYGMQNSHFENPNGLDSKDHYSTAYDMALISSIALKNDDFFTIVTTKYIEISGEPKRYLKNKNKMLWEYECATGIKTGYTKQAGRCLASSAIKNGVHLVSIVLNTPDMWNVSKENLEKSFKNYT